MAAREAEGLNPYPVVLDEMLENIPVDGTYFVGTMDIPVDRILGTKTAGRTSAFSANFLPLLDVTSEFALKWIPLCSDHLGDEGIRDPLVCYEYMGNFYVQEGNKRLSVLKHFGATYIYSKVYRVMPVMNDSAEHRSYSEFLEFFRHARVYDLRFSQPGSYAKLLKHMGMAPDQDWMEDDRRKYRAYASYFRDAFRSLGGENLKTTADDALLLWLQVHPYSDLGNLSTAQLKKSLQEMWDNVVGMEADAPEVRTEAPEVKPSFFGRMLSPRHVNVAFVHLSTPEISTWTHAHESGRDYLEKTLGNAVTVRSYFNADTEELAQQLLEQAVADGADVVFATSPRLVEPCLKASIRYPKVRFFSCSVQTPYSTVHTYYSRIYEAKFITGAIAGAMADNNRIGYVGTFPIYGVPASINAFALGAMMTNPRAEIELKWSCLPGNPTEEFLNDGIWVFSNRHESAEERKLTEYGTYFVDEDGRFNPIGNPLWEWGKYYEKVIRSILSGTWDSNRSGHAVNDWWGISSGVIDLELSENLPEGLKALANILQEGLRNGTIDPFKRKIVDQQGNVINTGSRSLTPEELIHMDWLCSNVKGRIPGYDELLPVGKSMVRVLGIHKDEIPEV